MSILSAKPEQLITFCTQISPLIFSVNLLNFRYTSCIASSSDRRCLFVVSSAVCDRCCVFMRVSSWWRAVSVHGVYAGGKCDPSQPGLLPRCLSTALHSHLISPSSLLWRAGSSGEGRLQITFPLEKIQPRLYTLRKNNMRFMLHAIMTA